VEVYTCGDLSFLERLETDPDFTRKEVRRIKKQILASESYYIPQQKIAYLASLSLNHAAEEASHFIRNLCAGNEFPREPADAFYANALHEAVGFSAPRSSTIIESASMRRILRASSIFQKLRDPCALAPGLRT
jgi:hypothetical protein